MASSNDFIYVVFSRTQLQKNTEIYAKQGKKYANMYVIVKGRPVEYTDIVTDKKLIKFVDSTIVTSGIRNKLSFSTK